MWNPKENAFALTLAFTTFAKEEKVTSLSKQKNIRIDFEIKRLKKLQSKGHWDLDEIQIASIAGEVEHAIQKVLYFYFLTTTMLSDVL